jgi:ammonia channel protein AmtB
VPTPELAANYKLTFVAFARIQSMFACVTPVIIIGGFAERARILPIRTLITATTKEDYFQGS